MPWTIDGETADVSQFTISPTQISVTFTAYRDEIDKWRRYERPGDFSEISGYEGYFEVEPDDDRAETTINPGSGESPPMDTADGYVSAYDEQHVAADRYQVSISIRRDEPREGVFSALDQSADDWTLVTSRGTLGLAAEQVLLADGTGSAAGTQRSLPLRLTDDQAAHVADTMSRPAAILARAVPDGRDFYESSARRQRVDLQTPDGSSVRDGQWGVIGWSLERGGYGQYPWNVDLDLGLIDATPVAGMAGGSRWGHHLAGGT